MRVEARPGDAPTRVQLTGPIATALIADAERLFGGPGWIEDSQATGTRHSRDAGNAD